MAECLPIVDVSVDTAAQTWPLLQQAMDQADFIALDLELSGLGHNKTRNVAPNLEEKYKAMREVAASHGILSVGVACFKWHQQHDSCEGEEDGTSCDGCECTVEVFNIWLLSNEPYTIDPSSAKFLIQHGFDFNKHFAQGIRYTPTTTELSSEECSMQMLFARLLCSSKPVVVHNGWIDLIFLYHNFYTTLPPSLGSFMADLSEMFTGGIYDTKAIAQHTAAEHATFLEYIFRKRQNVNSFDQSESRRHLKLHYASYDAEISSCINHVTVTPPTPPPLEQLLQIQMCHTFERYGYCNQPSCGKSHEVVIAVAHEEHYAAVKTASAKRKREHRQQRKLLKKAKLDDKDSSEHTKETPITDLSITPCDGEPDETELEPTTSAPTTSNPTSSLADIFKKELSKAKTKLYKEQDTPPAGVLRKPSFGHRAGFDAFMTGFAFECYCVMQSAKNTKREEDTAVVPVSVTTACGAADENNESCVKQSGEKTEREENAEVMAVTTTCGTDKNNESELECSKKDCDDGGHTVDQWWLTGLEEMKNRLGNRGKSLPMVVAKSHFAKTSEAHRLAQKKLRTLLGREQPQSEEK